MVAKLVRVSGGKAFAVDVHESFGGQSAVGAVRPEAPVPLLYRVLVVPGRRLEELHVGLAQPLLAPLLTHPVAPREISLTTEYYLLQSPKFVNFCAPSKNDAKTYRQRTHLWDIGQTFGTA